MEILNAEFIWAETAEAIAMLGFVPVLVFGIIGFIYSLDSNAIAGKIVSAIIIIIGITMIIYGNMMPKIQTYDVILTDKTYYELIEDYDVISTEGRILTIKEKN